MKTFILILLPLFLGMTCSSTQPTPPPSSGPKVDASDIIRQLNSGEHVLYNGKEITGDLDFTQLDGAYPENVGTQRVEVSGSVTFIDCHFLGEVRAFQQADKSVKVVSFLRNLSFVNCRFDKSVDFRNMIVEGNSNWQKSVFKEGYRISGTVFERLSDFDGADFIGPFQAQEAQFHGAAKFMNAVFENTANFQKAQFHQTAQFGVARFLGYTEFNSVWAQRNFLFSYAQFHGRAFFQNARFDDRTEFFQTHFHKIASFSKSRFYGDVKMRELVIDESLSFEKCQFDEEPEGWEELEKLSGEKVKMTEAKAGN